MSASDRSELLKGDTVDDSDQDDAKSDAIGNRFLRISVHQEEILLER